MQPTWVAACPTVNHTPKSTGGSLSCLACRIRHWDPIRWPPTPDWCPQTQQVLPCVPDISSLAFPYISVGTLYMDVPFPSWAFFRLSISMMCAPFPSLSMAMTTIALVTIAHYLQHWISITRTWISQFSCTCWHLACSDACGCRIAFCCRVGDIELQHPTNADWAADHEPSNTDSSGLNLFGGAWRCLK
jgi:hypothetical protein